MACVVSSKGREGLAMTSAGSLGKTLLEGRAWQVHDVKRHRCAPDCIPDLHADYKLHGKVVGTGASCSVHVATCRRTGEQVAVKRMKKKDLDAAGLAELRKEVSVHEKVSHPGIVELRAAYESATTISLVMEELTGGELLHYVQDRRVLSETEAAKVTLQIIRALAYLHARHIVHRDIKLENLMYKSEKHDSVKLIDFGLATQRADGKKLTDCCGTPQYVAPEVVQGMAYDEAADVWSLGVVVYSLLTGEQLFKDEYDVIQQMITGKPKYCKGFHKLSKQAQNFVNALLSYRPAKRATVFQAATHPWLRAVASKEAADTLSLIAEDSPEAKTLLGSAPRTKELALAVAGVSLLAVGWFSLK